MASADEYAAWIVANEGKKGTPEFDIVAKAYQEAKNDQPAVVTAGNALRSIPRQIGLTVRHGMEGLGEVANIGSEPIRALVNPVLGAVGLPKATGSAKDLATAGADALGLPSPQNANERVAGDVSRMMAGSVAMSGAAGAKAGTLVSPFAKTLQAQRAAGLPVNLATPAPSVAANLAANPGIQAASAAGAGGAGGAVREAGGGPLEQFGASLVGGLGAASLSALALKAYNGISAAVGSLLKPKQTTQTINVTLNQILEQNGIDVAKIPGQVRAELAFEVKKALDTGKELNPDVVRRIADYGVVGATPTRGTVTLDPAQITQEQNLSKMGMNASDPKLQELGRIKNTNNAKFIENLNTMGGGTANANPLVAGEKAIGAVTAKDAAEKSAENALYKQARDSTGRALDLDSEGFVAQAYDNLAKSNKGAFLPENISKVLDQIRSGKVTMGGKEYPAPFTVDTIDNIKTMLATASRGSADGNTRAAIKEVRAALENVQPRAVGRPVGGNQIVEPGALNAAQGKADDSATAAMNAFDKARAFARERRTWQESAPGIAAALDDAKPDTFVKEFILSGSNKAASADVERLMFAVKKDPHAFQAVKENVVGYLKSKALSGAADEVGNFSQSGYNKALTELGNKLNLFFSKDEIAQLKTLGRVASYEMVQPKGSAVNNSNTAGTFAGFLDKIASSPLVGKIPFGDVALRTPARNWSTQIGTSRALDAGSAMVRPSQSKEMMRLEQLIGPGLLLTAPRADGRNDEKRR